MIFNTHDRTPKIKTNKTLKILLILCWSFMGVFFLFAAIATSVMSKSPLPTLIILIPVALISALILVTVIDMNKAYVQIEEENVTVIDYYFLSKKEKSFKLNEITSAEVLYGGSLRVRGYRYRAAGFSYIVFKDANNNYLFKIINCPETKEFFSKYFQFE